MGGGEEEGIEVALVHSLTDTALAQLCKAVPCPCAATAGGLNFGLTLPERKPQSTSLHYSEGTLLQPLCLTIPIEKSMPICFILNLKSQQGKKVV